MFNSSQSTFFIIGCIASACLILTLLHKIFSPKQQYFAKRPITHFEQKMFARLNLAFPQYHVLAQVAFSALITSQNYQIRNKFNRKVTDFVILNHDMDVIAIIELDDPSHHHKQQEDAQRDEMFQQAGYKVLRYVNIPTIKQLHKDIV